MASGGYHQIIFSKPMSSLWKKNIIACDGCVNGGKTHGYPDNA